MRSRTEPERQGGEDTSEVAEVRPPYEPPRVLKKRSLARATLQFTGQGPVAAGPVAAGLVATG